MRLFKVIIVFLFFLVAIKLILLPFLVYAMEAIGWGQGY